MFTLISIYKGFFMNILIEASCFEPGKSGGIENFIYSLVRGFAEIKVHKVYVNISPGTKSQYEELLNLENVTFLEDKTQLIIKNYHKKSNIIKALVSILNRIGFYKDLYSSPRKSWAFHCEKFVDVVLYPMRYKVVHLRRPSIVVIHDLRDLDRGGQQELEAEYLKIDKAHALVTSWPHPFTLLHKFFPERIDDTFMVPFLTDPMPSDSDIIAEQEQRQFLYPASNGPDKNHEVLIKALGLLKSWGIEKIKVYCTGFQSSERKVILNTIAQELEVTDWIYFLGFVPREEIHRLYRISTAVITTTRYEAFSGAVLEGFCYGKPIACSHIAPLSELIDQMQVEVRYFNQEDPEDVAQAMIDILKDRKPFIESSLRARRMLQKITLQNTAAQYIDILSWISGKAEKPQWFPFKSIFKDA